MKHLFRNSLFIILAFSCNTSKKNKVAKNVDYEAMHIVSRHVKEYLMFLDDNHYVHSIPEFAISDTSTWHYLDDKKVYLNDYSIYFDPNNGYMYLNYPQEIKKMGIMFIVRDDKLFQGDFYYSIVR